MFEVTDHVDGCDAVGNRVIANLLNAVENEMGYFMMRLGDRAIAEDLHERAEDLQDVAVDDIVPHVATWRGKVKTQLDAGASLDHDEEEDDDPFVDFKRKLGLSEDAEVVGPIGAGSLRALLEKLAPGRSEDDAHFHVLRQSMNNVANLMNNDRADDIQVESRSWTFVVGAPSRMMATTSRDSDGDQHMFVVMQDEKNRLKWRLWTLCPITGMSSALIIIGTEQRAIHRACMLADLGSGRLPKEKFYETASGKKWPTPPAAGEGVDDAEDDAAG